MYWREDLPSPLSQGDLVLSNFEIEDFRTFHRLRVDRLGRVNLIVGRNNVGKTMFLEAIRLYASGGNLMALRNLLLERDEVITDAQVATLFHRPPSGRVEPAVIRLGPIDDGSQILRIQSRRLARIRSRESVGVGYTLHLLKENDPKDDLNSIPGLVVTWGTTQKAIYPFQHIDARRHRHPAGYDNVTRPAFVSARGVSDREIARWWDSVVLHDAEQRVIDCLKIIAPVERINLVEHPVRRGERLVLMKMAGDAVPVPLKSLGDGTARMFQIALALECARAGRIEGVDSDGGELFLDRDVEEQPLDPLILLDEVENGIHYTVLPDLWRFILQLSKLHNIQVFATTHSWDCILGLQAAAVDVPDAQAMLIRLDRRPLATKAVSFDQTELAIVARDEIEVR